MGVQVPPSRPFYNENLMVNFSDIDYDEKTLAFKLAVILHSKTISKDLAKVMIGEILIHCNYADTDEILSEYTVRPQEMI